MDFPIDGLDRLYGLWLITVKTQAFQESEKDSIDRGSLNSSYAKKIVGGFSETSWRNQ